MPKPIDFDNLIFEFLSDVKMYLVPKGIFKKTKYIGPIDFGEPKEF